MRRSVDRAASGDMVVVLNKEKVQRCLFVGVLVVADVGELRNANSVERKSVVRSLWEY